MVEGRQGASAFHRATTVVVGLAFCVAFLVDYAIAIVPHFAYSGMVHANLPGWAWPVVVFLAGLPLFYLPVDITRPSDCVPWFLYLCVVVPTSLLCFVFTSLRPEQVIVLPVVLVAVFSLFEYWRRKPPLLAPAGLENGELLLSALPVVMLAISAAQMAKVGFHFQFSMEDIYERRLAARDLVPSGTLLAYAIAFLNGVCIPFGLAVALSRRRWILLVPVGIAIVSTFTFSGQKVVLFAPIALAVIVFLTMHHARRGGLILLSLGLAFLLVALAEATFNETTVLSTVFVRRMMAMPAQLTTYYWEFFTANPPVMLTDNPVVGSFLGARYDLGVGRLIGKVYFGSDTANANANMWAAGFAHFGYVGMVAVSFFSAVLLRIADGLSSGGGLFVPGSVVCAALAIVWTNSALHTSMLSNGVLALLVLLYFFPLEATSRDG